MHAYHRAAAAVLLSAVCLFGHNARAAEAYDNCTGYIDSLPASLTTQGTWCLRKDVATSVASGAAITINAPNITIDCNNFKIGGLGAGANTRAEGIFSLNRNNTTVRNCAVRGFWVGIDLTGAANLVEHNRLEANTWIGIAVEGDASVIRDNLITATGGTDFNNGVEGVGIRAMGVFAVEDVDILDNVIAGVVAKTGTQGLAIAIESGNNMAGSIIGNSVRGVVADGAAYVDSVSLWGTIGRVTVTDNRFIGTGAINSIGVRCGDNGTANDVIVANNVVNGMQYLHTNCAQPTDNLHRPVLLP
jgi:hypothetical protein